MAYYIIKMRGYEHLSAAVANCADHEDLILNFPPDKYSYLYDVLTAPPKLIEFNTVDNAVRYRNMLNGGRKFLTRDFA